MKFVANDSERAYNLRYNSEWAYNLCYEFSQPYRWKRRKSINEMKVNNGAMLRRVHKLCEKWKYEIDPNIQRELRTKYKKL